MIDEIALSGNTCFIFMHSTLYRPILLMRPRGVCTLEIIELWLKGNQIEYSFTTVTTLRPKYTVHVTQKAGCWNIFREKLHFFSQSVL
jgi:hypothetical protein